MKTKVKTFFAVVGVLLVVTAISLIIGRGPLYGQAENDNWVPNMIGTWGMSEGVGYYFEDVTDPACIPKYTVSSLDPDPEAEGYLHITHQTGRVFAGTWWSGSDPDVVVRKLSGVMLPDRTVSIQAFETSEYRIFITGRMTKSGGTLQISGYAHSFDDINHSHGPYDPYLGTMSSGYAQLIKID